MLIILNMIFISYTFLSLIKFVLYHLKENKILYKIVYYNNCMKINLLDYLNKIVEKYNYIIHLNANTC